MKKLLSRLGDNILFVITLFLIVFIPLYPKRPLLDIVNTWVYVRVEDFIVILVLSIWTFLLIKKKTTLRTPLTIPILIFWIVGAIATIHGILLIFPTMANVFPNVAFLSFLRRIEYLSLFFVTYAAITNKRHLAYVITALVVTLFLVFVYGVGQKYLGFPAFLTMNEEFAKGIPITLSALSRVPSTFGGHYDLAAYLVFVLPIVASLLFGIKNFFVRLILLVALACGFVLLFMTVSRVSFLVLFAGLFVVLLFQKRKLILFSLPVIAVVALLFVSFSSTLLDRFGSTIKEVDVLVDAKTGVVLGHAKEVPPDYFQNKVIIHKTYLDKLQDQDIKLNQESVLASASAAASPTLVSPVIPYYALPEKVILLVPTDTSTGENLPQGTGYINLTLSPVVRKVGEYFYEQQDKKNATKLADVLIINGSFLVKRAAAYDLSFTTRFQGEWPHALDAFRKNILFGSGYSSISLSIDNNYLRILGEVGLLGFLSFAGIFVAIAVYIRKVLPEVDSPLVKSFTIGYIGGLVGLAFNAVLIDVFEASKVAFLLWIVTGVVLGTLALYKKTSFSLLKESKRILGSPLAIGMYLAVLTLFIYSPMLPNYFVGDDYTWLRWVAECKEIALESCSPSFSAVASYFTDSNGFFYRPGTKIYFLGMYSAFWLNQTIYHAVSMSLHYIVALLFFFVARKTFQSSLLAGFASVLFLILSGYSEAVFWISSTGFLFTTIFGLSSMLLFRAWRERKKSFFLILAVLSTVFGLFFHELGIIIPFLVLLYEAIHDESFSLRSFWKKISYCLLFVPLLPYLVLRFVAQSHWFSGDYSYNLLKLPFNAVGNTIGYLLLSLFGPISLPFYSILRNATRENIIIGVFASGLLLFIAISVGKKVYENARKDERRILLFSTLFFVISLSPFLGLGNITSRYSYLATLGFVLLFVFILKKVYVYLLASGKEIAVSVVVLILSVYSLLHVMQVQQIHGDWHEAGEKVQRFFIGIDESYADYWGEAPMKFYFVNVPTKTGEAWVFPVGLVDGLWFTIRNPNISVYQYSSLNQVFDSISGEKNEKVFLFDASGAVAEKKKPQKTQ